MPRTVVIEQPNYIPWLGYFDLMRQSDVWVWYDDVQYTRRDWRNRNRVATEDGSSVVWLTIPVKSKGRFSQAICDVEIDYEQNWVRRHLLTIRRCYARAPFFDLVHQLLESALEARPQRLADLTIGLNESICARLGFSTRFVRSSHLPRDAGERTGRLVEICRRLDATAYLSGPSASAYIVPPSFQSAGIELRYVVYEYPPYERGPHEFVPRLSIVDAIAWIGPERTAALLAAHGRSMRGGSEC